MALVLDSPVAADTLVHSGSCHFQCFPAGEDEGVLLADPVAGDLEDLAADAGGKSMPSAPVSQQDHFFIRPRLCSSMMWCGAPESSGRILSNTCLCRVGWFPLTVIRYFHPGLAPMY